VKQVQNVQTANRNR